MSGTRGGAPRIAAVVLAAGASTRMGKKNKLLATLDGRPVIQHVVAAAQASRADPVVVVLGNRAKEIRAALGRASEVGLELVENPSPETGLASSLVAGVQALPASVEGCVVMLGDMPFVRPADVDSLIVAFDVNGPTVPVVEGRRGNPVLWPRTFFADLLGLTGDRGARALFDAPETTVVEVPLDNVGLLLDIDTPEDLKRARSVAPSAETHHGVEEAAGPGPGEARSRQTRDTEEPAPWRR